MIKREPFDLPVVLAMKQFFYERVHHFTRKSNKKGLTLVTS